jgi:hypothetical protein
VSAQKNPDRTRTPNEADRTAVLSGADPKRDVKGREHRDGQRRLLDHVELTYRPAQHSNDVNLGHPRSAARARVAGVTRALAAVAGCGYGCDCSVQAASSAGLITIGEAVLRSATTIM